MKKLYCNIIVLVIAVCFVAAGFIGAATSAQTKKTAKATPTPKTKKAPATTAKATPKPTPKTTSKSKAVATSKTAKTSDKTKSAALTSKTKPSAQKDKAAANSKNSGNSNKTSNKTKTQVATKSVPKSSVKSATNSAPKPTAKTPQKTPSAPKTTSKSNAGGQVIVMAAGSRIREQPKANAAQLGSVRIGKTLPVAEKNAAWYRVEYETGKSGWISKTTVRDYESDDRDEIYSEIADRYYKSKSLDFATATELVDFLRTAQVLVRTDTLKADLAFKRLQILAAAMRAVPFGKSEQTPYKTFLKAHEKEVVYSEPSGQWYVRSELFWELHNKFTQLPIAEEIAWEAAKNPIPGECEGYVNCYLYLLRATDGEYLNFYPSGKYSKKALSNITNLLEPIIADLSAKTVYTPPSDISDRAEFNRFLTELRTIISKMPDVDKAKTLQQINQLGEGYK